MSLTAKDKALVKSFFAKIAPKAEDIGNEALSRTLFVFPQTKTYFSHWKDVSPGSAAIRKHGLTVMTGYMDAVEKIDDIANGLLTLSELHAFTLRVDPANFKIITHNVLVVMAMFYPEDFTPEVHVACDKFFGKVNLALSEKYR
ncbi:hemoglobin subunit alpha-1-like [Clupea harengus]|uniref:Hemoglobin subunit alpha-1-like n=1 Tax=Clupea harengus TaxID=7950 RepID=A0A6P3W5X5_CLUHA|nr:hemoglobin subunit alpha-1-like [Clupea harengus]